MSLQFYLFTTVITVTNITTVTTVITVTSIIVRYQMLLLYFSKSNSFTKVLDRQTDQQTN